MAAARCNRCLSMSPSSPGFARRRRWPERYRECMSPPRGTAAEALEPGGERPPTGVDPKDGLLKVARDVKSRSNERTEGPPR